MARIKRSLFEVGMAVLAVLGMARSAYFHLGHPGSGLAHRGTEIDAIYEEIRRDLPNQQWLGYVSDLHFGLGFQDHLWLQASYALAPKRLEREPSSRTWVVARLEDPAQLAPIAASYHLEIVTRYREGHLALLRKRERP